MSFLTDEEELSYSDLADPFPSGPIINDLYEIRLSLKELIADLKGYDMIWSLLFSVSGICLLLVYVVNR